MRKATWMPIQYFLSVKLDVGAYIKTRDSILNHEISCHTPCWEDIPYLNVAVVIDLLLRLMCYDWSSHKGHLSYVAT